MADEEIIKASSQVNPNLNVVTSTSLNPSTQRMKMGAYSLPSLANLQGRILEEARAELRFPQSNFLYKNMLLDANVSSPLNFIIAVISGNKGSFTVPEDASPEEKNRCEMLNYNMLIMDRPWEEYIVEFLSYLAYGFSTPEKIYDRNVVTPMGTFVGWKDFRMISQDTVDKWIFHKKTGVLAGLQQNINLVPNNFVGEGAFGKRVDIPRKKFMLFRNNPQRNNPEGVSPLKCIYKSWKMKGLIEEYQTIGVSKDMGGVVELGVDVGYLAKAQADPNSEQGKVLEAMKLSAANMHAGDQSYVITPIAYNEQGKELFRFGLKGIDGGGKQYDSSEIIKQHNHDILMTFFADVLSLGQDGGGSFSLSDSKISMLEVGIEAILKNIERTLNHDLVRQTYELNEWEYDARTACKFGFEKVEKKDLDKLGAFVQRVTAVGALLTTSDLNDKMRDEIGLAPMDIAKPEVFVQDTTSKSGEGMKEGLGNGTGTSSSKGSDSSVSNKAQVTS